MEGSVQVRRLAVWAQIHAVLRAVGLSIDSGSAAQSARPNATLSTPKQPVPEESAGMLSKSRWPQNQRRRAQPALDPVQQSRSKTVIAFDVGRDTFVAVCCRSHSSHMTDRRPPNPPARSAQMPHGSTRSRADKARPTAMTGL